MMLTISLTSKADISIYIYKVDYIFFFHTLDFKEPLSPSTRWCFFNDLLCTT